MASYKLAPLADADLVNIANKTIDDWGYKQAKVYLQAIDTALNTLAQTPAIGKPRPEVYKNARSFPVEKHIVYYQQSNDGIEVARILHQRMDPSKHF